MNKYINHQPDYIKKKIKLEPHIGSYSYPNTPPVSRGETDTTWTGFHKDVYDIADELAELLISKHKDYGPTNIAHAPGGALNGLRVRIHDKIARINHLIDSGKKPEHESLEDSFKDLANYAIIALMVNRGKWPTK
jgi:hypothetical protein